MTLVEMFMSHDFKKNNTVINLLLDIVNRLIKQTGVSLKSI